MNPHPTIPSARVRGRPAAALAIDAAAASRRGRKRAVNEDVLDLQVRNSPDGRPVGLAILCDGLGGYEDGEIAGRLALEVMRKALFDAIPGLEDRPPDISAVQPDRTYLLRRLSEAVRCANERIFRFSRQNIHGAFPHAGTAMTLVALFGTRAVTAHIGNSRIYRFREGRISQLTRDHTVIGDLIRAGVLEPEKARLHPQRNILTRALGTRPDVRVDMDTLDLLPGDRLLICSNGLWSSLPSDLAIERILARNLPSDVAASELVQAAHDLDGSDDLSAIVVDILDPIQK